MRGAALPVLLSAVLLGATLWSCGAREQEATPPSPGATRTAAVESRTLGAHDVQVYVAVKAKALQRIEDELDRLGADPASIPASIDDLSAAERGAASALGVGWRDYTWIRDEIARLLGDQRQREDARILMLELTRTRDDLKAQMAQVRDDASRQFLAAQLRSLDDKLAALDADRRVPQDEAGELAVVEDARAELATLQGRQDRLQKKLRDLLQAAHARRAAATPPGGQRGRGTGDSGPGRPPTPPPPAR